MWSPSVISKTRRRPFFCRLTDATILRRALFVSLPSCRQGGATRWVACVYGGQTWQARTQHPRRGERGAVHLVHVELGRGRNGVERCPWERAHRHGRVVGVVGGGVQVCDGLRRHEATRGHHEEGITSRGTGPARHIAARGGPRAARHGARRGAARGAGSGTTHLLDQVEPLVAHLGGALERARRVEGRRLVPLQQGLALDKEADVPAACARACVPRGAAVAGGGERGGGGRGKFCSRRAPGAPGARARPTSSPRSRCRRAQSPARHTWRWRRPSRPGRLC